MLHKPVALDLPGAIANIRREGTPRRVFQYEHGLEPGIKQALCERFNLCAGLDESDEHFALRREIRINQFVGLEFLRILPNVGITVPTPRPPVGPIRSWADFESYHWPTIEEIDFSVTEWYERNLPDNMAMFTFTYPFQETHDLLGFVPMCTMLYDQRDLVKAVVDKLGVYYEEVTRLFCQFSRFGAIAFGDDMGHGTGTFISPNDLRELFFPWHKKIADIAHRHGKLAIMHSCGQIESIMGDLIDSAGIDAHHSTQDAVQPIAISKDRWGKRVALLGGVDVDFITRKDARSVRTYTRNILEHCVVGGGFALGVGNWVWDALPI
ncbi:MAG: hypothetical protein HQ546_01900, partial [Planctomycetes bacterium]|nr:hypothetical protein [Planctomycetota bacterium]